MIDGNAVVLATQECWCAPGKPAPGEKHELTCRAAAVLRWKLNYAESLLKRCRCGFVDHDLDCDYQERRDALVGPPK